MIIHEKVSYKSGIHIQFFHRCSIAPVSIIGRCRNGITFRIHLNPLNTRLGINRRGLAHISLYL